jgi:benzoate-CoA ligase
MVRIPELFNVADWFVERPAQAHPARVAIAGEPESVTYGALHGLTARAAGALTAGGCACGDRVLIALPDSAEFMAAFFGAARIGALAVPVNPFSRSSDFSYFLSDCSPALAIVHAGILPEFLQAHWRPESTVVVGAGAEARGRGPTRTWEEWLDEAREHAPAAQTRSSDPAFFLYTSGSTGGPKAAVHRHGDMLATSETFAKGVLGITEADRTFSVSKLFFAYGLGNGMYFPLATGATTILNPDKPRPDLVLELVAKHRPTLFFTVPTFYAALLRAAEGRETDFSSVRIAVSAGEALPVEIFQQFKQRFGLEILDAIGSTEMLHMFISSVPGRIRPGSCGSPLPGYEATIVDEAGRIVPAGETGNLWVRGPSAFREYWGQPEKTQAARVGEWVVTGDKFYCDPDGYYFYCGRSDDMMKVAGMWVAPGEVENALLSHPAVAEAAAVGREEAGLLRLVGVVVLRDGAAAGSALEDELRQFVRARLTAYKCPQQILFVTELPKTATGKIQRFRLRQTIAKGPAPGG